MIFFILLLGVVLRLLMLASEKSFWGDEWFTIDLVQQPFADVFSGAIQDVHPPLYFLALSVIVQVVGHSEWVFRSLSFISSVGLIISVFLVGRELFNRKAALLASLLVAISPYFLQLSNEVRSYCFLACVCTFATFTFLKAVRNPNRKIWTVLFVALATCAVYVEHYAWFWLFGIMLYTAYLVITSWKQHRRWVGLHALTLVACFPSLGLIVYQAIFNENALDVARISEFYSLPLLAKKGVAVYWHFFCGPIFSMLTVDRIIHYVKTSPLFWFSFLVTVVSTGVCVRALVTLARKRMDICILFLGLALFPVLFLLIVYPIRLDARYLSFVAPVMLILLSVGLLEIKWRPLSYAVSILVGSVAIYGALYVIRLDTDAIHKEDYRGMTRYALTNAHPADVIVGLGMPTDYYRAEFGVGKDAAYFSSRDTFFAYPNKKFPTVWFLNYIDMDSRVNDKRYAAIERKMAADGYQPMVRLLRFGGPDSLTALHTFKKK